MSQQLTLPFVHHTSYDPADFIVGPANGEAYGLLRRWPEWPSRSLCLVGPSGSGKTHLVAVYQSIVPTAVVLDVATLSLEKLAQIFGAAAVIMENADDIQDQNLLFHLLNTVWQGKGTILMTAHSAPSAWGHTLPDVVSRLKTIPYAQVTLPDPFLLRDLMLKLFSDRQINVDISVLETVAARMHRTYANAHEVVSALDERAAQLRRPISRSLVRELFQERSDLFSAQRPTY